MTASPIIQGPIIQGWCPGALRPMASGDGYVMRIRPPLGELSPQQAKVIAGLARRYGNGLIDLSARANLQLRGTKADDHPAIWDILRQYNLLDETVAAETRRNIMVQPFWTAGDITHHIAQTLTRAVIAADDLALPAKFGFAVDPGPVPLLQDAAADIRIEQYEGRLILRPDGADHAKNITPDNAAQTALDLARQFITTGGITDMRGRMRAHVQHMPLPPDFTPAPRLQGHIPLPDPNKGLIGLEFGRITADMLALLADYGPLRLTPWRMIWLQQGHELPPMDGLIHDPTNPLLNVMACPGAPFCPQAHQETRNFARALAPHLRQKTHISGCAKGCAYPSAAPCTLCAVPQGFHLIHHGCAHDAPKGTYSAQEILTTPSLLTE